MSRTMVAAAVVAVALAVVGYLVLRGGGDDDTGEGTEAAAARASGGKTETVRRPGLPAPRINPVAVPEGGEPAVEGAERIAKAAFSQEPVDDAWAPAKTTAIRKHLDLLAGRMPDGARVADIRCRTTRCQLDVAGDKGAAGAVLELLQSPEGFHGSAKSLYVRTPTATPDSASDLALILELRFR